MLGALYNKLKLFKDSFFANFSKGFWKGNGTEEDLKKICEFLNCKIEDICPFFVDMPYFNIFLIFCLCILTATQGFLSACRAHANTNVRHSQSSTAR